MIVISKMKYFCRVVIHTRDRKVSAFAHIFWYYTCLTILYYPVYKSMDLSDVQTAPTLTMLLVHGIIVEVLR